MFERKIHIINDKKKYLKYICVKAILPTLIIACSGLLLRFLGNLMLKYLKEEYTTFGIMDILVFILLTVTLFMSFVYGISKRYKFNMIKVSEKDITLCYVDRDVVYSLEDIYLERKKKAFKIVLKKNRQKFSIPLFMLKDSDFRNISNDMKKYNVKIRR